MDTCLGKLLAKMKPAPFPEEVIGKIVVTVVKALHYLKTEFAVIHRGERLLVDVFDYLVCLSVSPSVFMFKSSLCVCVCVCVCVCACVIIH